MRVSVSEIPLNGSEAAVKSVYLAQFSSDQKEYLTVLIMQQDSCRAMIMKQTTSK